MIKIIEGGMEYTFGKTDIKGCSDCKVQDTCSCDHAFRSICERFSIGECVKVVSAQKITEEAKVYEHWCRDSARHLIGVSVEYHSGQYGSSWEKKKLDTIDHTGSPFRMVDGSYAKTIREITQRHLTWPQIQALHDDLADVVLVEEKLKDRHPEIKPYMCE